MKLIDACDAAYRNGYEKGKADATKEGEWEEHSDFLCDTFYRCSVCGEDFVTIEGTPIENSWNFCPNCGAKMKGINRKENGDEDND